MTHAHLPRHPAFLVASASSARLEDPRLEQERVVLIGAALAAGREASRALEAWLAQSLVEYRGSRSAWDLEATTAELCRALDRYDATMRDMAARLCALLPGIAEESAESSRPDAPARPGTRVLREVDAASRLLLAIQSATAESGLRGDAVGRRGERRSVA